MLLLCWGQERGTKRLKKEGKTNKNHKRLSQRKAFKLLTKCRKKKTVFRQLEFSRGEVSDSNNPIKNQKKTPGNPR